MNRGRNCKEIRKQLLDVLETESMGNPARVPPAVATHVQECEACASELDSLRQTLTVLDQWQAPEPSPYFDSRLQARMQDEKEPAAARPWGILGWASMRWQPVMAGALALALVVGGVWYSQFSVRPPVIAMSGSAVGDLQALDKNGDIYNNFDLLDDDQQDE